MGDGRAGAFVADGDGGMTAISINVARNVLTIPKDEIRVGLVAGVRCLLGDQPYVNT